MDAKIKIEIPVNAGSRRYLHKLPGERLAHQLAELQRIGSGVAIAEYLADCREDLHRRMEAPGLSSDELRSMAGAAGALSDLAGIFSQSMTLLQAMKKASAS